MITDPSVFVDRDLLIFGVKTEKRLTPSAFFFVTHLGRPPDDRIVQGRSWPLCDEKDQRSVFRIEGSPGAYKIRCPSYENRYLFASYDEEEYGDHRHRIVEARIQPDPRMWFDIQAVAPNRYTVRCTETNTYVGTSVNKEDNDYYIIHDAEPQEIMLLGPVE
jgi:hypothetical protein